MGTNLKEITLWPSRIGQGHLSAIPSKVLLRYIIPQSFVKFRWILLDLLHGNWFQRNDPVTLKNRSRSPISNPKRGITEVHNPTKFRQISLNPSWVIARKPKFYKNDPVTLANRSRSSKYNPQVRSYHGTSPCKISFSYVQSFWSYAQKQNFT